MDTYKVQYLGGVTIYPEKAKGTLTFEQHQLTFKSEKNNLTIPTDSIVDVKTRPKTDKTLMAGSYLALGLLGPLWARKNKEDQIGILTISFTDAVGDLQHPEFAFMPTVRQAAEIKSIDLVNEATKQLYELRLKTKGNA